MSIELDRERLLQKHNLEWIQRDLKATDMVIVCRPNLGKITSDYFILGGLIPYNLAEKVLSGEHISGVIENVWPEPTAYRSEITSGLIVWDSRKHSPKFLNRLWILLIFLPL